MLNEMKKNQKGFTLVELIVVIAIMAVLATLLIPRIMGNVKDAADQAEISSARTLASEITIHNATAAADTADTIVSVPATLPTAPAKHTVVVGDLVGNLVVPASDFPDPTIVKILVDSEGNASIEIQGATPSGTP